MDVLVVWLVAVGCFDCWLASSLVGGYGSGMYDWLVRWLDSLMTE